MRFQKRLVPLARSVVQIAQNVNVSVTADSAPLDFLEWGAQLLERPLHHRRPSVPLRSPAVKRPLISALRGRELT